VAITIPIVTEFVGKGIDKARKEFSQLEGAGAKAGFLLKKSLLPATAALGALGAGAKSALDAGEAVNSANARIAQINKEMGLFGESTDYVNKRLVKLAEAQGRLTGVSNIQIKESQAQLLTFKSLAKTANVTGGAFDRASKAVLDMQAANVGGGNAAIALGKALEDPIKGITALAKSGVTFTDAEKEKIRTLVKSNKTLEAQDMILKAIETQVGGVAEATADDTAKMKEGFAQVSQSLGMTLLPVLEMVTPLVMKFADWARENPQLFQIIAAAIGGIALSIMAINFAMALNPFTAIAIGVGLLIAGIVVAYKRFEGFRKIIDTVFGLIKWWVTNVTIPVVESLLSVFKKVFNGIGTIWNNTLGKISFEIPSWVPGVGGKGFKFPKIPMLAEGGIVTGPTLAMIGEGRGPEAVIPLNRMGEFGMGGGKTEVNINVNGGDPQAVVDALRKFYRQNGPIPVGVSY
jgi:hypothetical protein